MKSPWSPLQVSKNIQIKLNAQVFRITNEVGPEDIFFGEGMVDFIQELGWLLAICTQADLREFNRPWVGLKEDENYSQHISLADDSASWVGMDLAVSGCLLINYSHQPTGRMNSWFFDRNECAKIAAWLRPIRAAVALLGGFPPSPEMSELELKITIPTPQPLFYVNGRAFISSLHAQLETMGGGSCLGLATESSINVQIYTEDRDVVDKLVASFIESLAKDGGRPTVVVNDKIGHPLSADMQTFAAALNAPPQKLTQKLLTALSEGSFLISNCMNSAGESIFAESVAPAELRRQQWQRISACRAAQRACHVFLSEAEGRRWLSAWRR